MTAGLGLGAGSARGPPLCPVRRAGSMERGTHLGGSSRSAGSEVLPASTCLPPARPSRRPPRAWTARCVASGSATTPSADSRIWLGCAWPGGLGGSVGRGRRGRWIEIRKHLSPDADLAGLGKGCPEVPRFQLPCASSHGRPPAGCARRSQAKAGRRRLRGAPCSPARRGRGCARAEKGAAPGGELRAGRARGLAVLVGGQTLPSSPYGLRRDRWRVRLQHLRPL